MAQTSPYSSVNAQAFKQQLQQLRDEIRQAVQSGNQTQVQVLKGEENALILGRMQERSAQKIEWAKEHPSALVSNNPKDQWRNTQTQLKIKLQDAIKSGDNKQAQQLKDQLAANAQELFAQVRANRQAWLETHPAEAAKRSQNEQFNKSQQPLFFELGAAIKSGDTQKAQRIRDQMAAARKQWLQTGQIP